MEFLENDNRFTATVGIPSTDQHFLLNFIMSNYLGPDVFSDNPRRSASQRLAENLPPYTMKNLGTSFLSVSQLESLYYYVLKDAHPTLIVEPEVLRLYLNGILPLATSVLLDDYRQFTSFFPASIHEQKRNSAGNEIIKGIVLIDDPVTREKDVEWFKCLTGMDDLRIDKIKSLSYNRDQKEQKLDEAVAKFSANGQGNGSGMILETYKRRSRKPSLSGVTPALKSAKEEGSLKRTYKVEGLAMMSISTVPNADDCVLDASISVTGTAKLGQIETT